MKFSLTKVAVFVFASTQMAHSAKVDQNAAALAGLRAIPLPETSQPQNSISNFRGMHPNAATASNGIIYSPTLLTNIQQLQIGWAADGSTFACYDSLLNDGNYFISCDGVNEPIITDSPLLSALNQLEGGLKLANSTGYVEFGAYRDSSGITTVMFLATDPNHTVGTVKVMDLWYADSTGKSGSLLSGGATFPGIDPTNKNVSTVFTVLTMSGLTVRDGKAVTLILATPTAQPGLTAGIQGLFAQIGTNGQVNVLLNNNLSATTSLLNAIAAFDMTNTEFYVFGQPAGQTAPSSTAVEAFRVENGLTTVKNFFVPTGALENSWTNGIQFYAVNVTNNGVVYSFLPDNSLPATSGVNTGEAVLFSGASIEGVALSNNDLQIITGQTSLDVITAVNSSNRSLLQIPATGQPELIHSPQTTPTGIAIAVAVTTGQTLYTQAESGGIKTYLLYQPTLTQTLYTVQPGANLSLLGVYLATQGLPSVSLIIGGIEVPYSGDSSGNVSIAIPANAQPGSYTGTVTVQPNIALAFIVQVVTPSQPVPSITSVVNGANFQADALVPRSHVTIFLDKSQAIGTQAAFSSWPTYNLGGISASFEGISMPLTFNGQGQINAVLPTEAAGQTQGSITVSIAYPSGTISSSPFPIKVGTVDDSFFLFSDTDGKILPIVTHLDGSLVNLASPAQANETIVGYGTGCAPSPSQLPADNVINPTSIPSAVLPTLNIGGQSQQILFAGLVQGYVGLCQYNFKVPSTVSGNLSMSFATSAYSYTLRVK